ncbi:MAG: hypothetical protein M1828_007533, partial [Chrysothrix sp. TS-e1954]
MSLQSSPDIVVHIKSENAASERRINPSWTLAHFRSRLEPITGIPPSAQRLQLGNTGGSAVDIVAADEDRTHLSHFTIGNYDEMT